tara:strand:+ start:56842 stop:58206 length:1365 start_codon:yes stop_codon:yes gene_type:complete
MKTSLIEKYNEPGPRYTSYPTVPYWNNDTFSLASYKKEVVKNFIQNNSSEGLSLYIHLPFCESMCTFCGCNKRITKKHEVERPYINALLEEWELYVHLLPERPRIKEIHLGGGTPTFFNPDNLEYLIQGLLRRGTLPAKQEFSFEGHPNNTTREHLQTLFDLGFRRVSYGVQDYSEVVQKAINRIQPIENVKKATALARQVGFTSVSHDLIFGLPFQTEDDIKKSIELTVQMRPERISFYSYAHTPWLKGNGQRGFKDEDLPDAQQKRSQYNLGKQLLLEAGYVEIGMDHFALPHDTIAKAAESGRLHRNFMGYTTNGTTMSIGLGVSAISDTWTAFGQNVKGLEEYYSLIQNKVLPIYRGHILTQEDLVTRKHILNLMCHFHTSWQAEETEPRQLADILQRLREMEKDELMYIGEKFVQITPRGRAFVRNVCMAFDNYLQRGFNDGKIFSMTI